MRVYRFIKEHRDTVLFILFTILFGTALIFRAFHGMDTTDETFYLATARRFYDGDLLFRDDWNTGQLFGLFLEPFYRLYCWIFGDNEGIILFFRIFFVVLELYVFTFAFRKLREHRVGFWPSLFASSCVLMYARGNIITISYYNLSFLTFLLSVLWWMEGVDSKKKRGFLLSGIHFSVSVLCMPYTGMLAVPIAGMGIYGCWKKQKEKQQSSFYFLLGIAFSAAVFLVYFFNKIPWENLFEYLPNMFQDPGMETEGALIQFKDLLSYIFTVFLKYTGIFYLITGIVSFLQGKGKIKNEVVRQCMPVILLTEFFIQSVYVRGYFEGGIVLTFFLFVLQLQLMHPEIRLKNMERYFVIPGALFGMVWVLGSNVGERVVNMSFLLMNLWAVPYLWKLFEQHRTYFRRLMYLPAVLMLAVLTFVRMFDVYRDGALSGLTYSISSGVMKGIRTEESRGRSYEETVAFLKEETEPGQVIAVLGCNPWGYLDSEASCGAYMTWELEDEDLLLEKYYAMFPEKIPDSILIVPTEVNTYEYWEYSSHGVGQNEEENVLSGILLDMEQAGWYEKKEQNGIQLYKRKQDACS